MEKDAIKLYIVSRDYFLYNVFLENDPDLDPYEKQHSPCVSLPIEKANDFCRILKEYYTMQNELEKLVEQFYKEKE